MQVRKKVEKSRITVFFQWFVAPEGRIVGSLKRRVDVYWKISEFRRKSQDTAANQKKEGEEKKEEEKKRKIRGKGREKTRIKQNNANMYNVMYSV